MQYYVLYCKRGGDKLPERNISFKVDSEFYKQIKIMLANEGKTLKTYIIELMKKDLEAKKK